MSDSTTTTNSGQNQNIQNIQSLNSPGQTVKVELLGHLQDQVEDPHYSNSQSEDLSTITMASQAHVNVKPIPVDPLAMELPISSPERLPVVPNSVRVGPSSPANRIIVHQQPQQIPQHQKFQDVRVDNWGNYCLQRLQVMYDRGDFCDLTMQFSTGHTLKVHRVVVNLCTEYFANLERLFGLTNGVLVLPKDVEYQAMVTIIKFFYTGKLEIRGNQFNEVYRTVKLMNITILIKLLEAHAKKPITQAKKEPTRPIVFKQAVEIGRPMHKGHGHTTTHTTHQMSGMQMSFTGTTAVSIPGGGGTTKQTLQVTTPGARLPPGVKTKTVLARVQPQTARVGQQSPTKSMSHKKLPIWKERKYTPASAMDPLRMEEIKKWSVKEEPARPTRFEWGDPEEDPSYMNTVVSHTLMDKQKDKQNSIRKAEDIFDAVKNQNLGKRNLMSSHAQDHSSTSKVQAPPAKIPRLGSQAAEKPVDPLGTSQNESDHVNLTDEVVEEEVSTTEVEAHPAQRKITSALKPALKSHPQGIRMTPMVGKNDPNLGDMNAQQIATTSGGSKISIGTGKTVRFASEIEKENNSKEIPIICSSTEDFASSHSKIIAEVLKKYPDLVKDKQNIKLKIVQKGNDASPSKEKSKVSYIVLKSTSSPDSGGSLMLKKPSHTTTNRAFWDPENKVEKKPSGAENTSGPWLCGPCGGSDETPMIFETYYSYRRHLVEVHSERIDARICEHCGQKASKRNLLLYHLYTKHGVPPPKNTIFPHCDRCDYVALSESLLNKHKQGHDATKEYSCQICNACFKSNGALQGHMTANLHRNLETKVYECPYCRKPFVRNINLKGHIRTLHKDIARIEEMDDPRLPHDDSLPHRSMNMQSRKRSFPSILAGGRHTPGSSVEIFPHNSVDEGHQVSLVTADGHTIEILHGIDPNTMSMPMTLVPSSEAEAMTNVASSIAASLGLESQGVHGTAEFMTGMTSDGSQAVYIMDSSQPAVEVDMSAMGLSSDGTIIYDGDDPSSQGQFIVQDIHGNQFRKITGIDETGKPVIFFQLSEENGQMTMAPAMMEDGMQITQDQSSVFVSSGMSMPITVSSDGSGQQGQVLLASNEHDGIVYEMEPTNHQDSHQQVVMSESVLSDHHHEGEEQQEFEHQEGQTVQELHIVLDQNEHNDGVEHEQVVEDEATIITEEEQHESIPETYVHNGECEEVENNPETGDQEEIQNTEHHEQDTLEVHQDGRHSDNGLNLEDQGEESSNIMEVVEESNIDSETQDLQVLETQESQIEEQTESEELQIHQDDTQELEVDENCVETQELEVDENCVETQQLEVDENCVETQELEITENCAETQELEIVHNSECEETQDMVAHHGEGVHMVAGEHEQLDTQVVEEEMELVEEVTGESMAIVEEVVLEEAKLTE